MKLIDENTRFPLRLVLTLVVAAVSLAGLGAVAQFKINDTAAKVDKLEASSHRYERKTQRVEDTLTDIREVLKEIKQDVKELRREQR